MVDELKQQQAAMNKITAKLDGLSDFHWELDANAMHYLKSVNNGLKSLKIPEEVKIKKELSFSNTAKNVLITFFCISLPIVVGSLIYGYKAWEYKQTTIQEGKLVTKHGHVSQEQAEWFIEYQKTMAKKNPKTHSSYLHSNPFPE